MYWELLHGVVEEEEMQMASSEFREHWHYRAMCFRINTNADINPVRREQYEQLMKQARIYREEHEL